MADTPIERVEKKSSMEDHCIQKIEEALADSTLGRMEQVMFYACYLHAHYGNQYRKTLEKMHRSLMDQLTEITTERQNTFKNPKQLAGKYGIAATHLFAAVLPFAAPTLASAAGGISAFGQGADGVMNLYGEKNQSDRLLYEHKSDMVRRLRDQTTQSERGAFDSIDTINRLWHEILRSDHQAKSQIFRG